MRGLEATEMRYLRQVTEHRMADMKYTADTTGELTTTDIITTDRKT
jgi:hypothetical protein